MIDIREWMGAFLQALDRTFAGRVWFVGLQGSYGRGEATEHSDIDAVVILDTLSAGDIESYGRMLDGLPCRELICGFVSGKQELLNWEPADLFQFYHDTVPVRGSMEDLLPLLDGETVGRAIKMGVCNVYHGCVHNMLFDKSEAVLQGLYKSAFFVVQAICFQQNGKYVRLQTELLQTVSREEQEIVETYMHLKNGGTVRFQEMSERLFDWAKKWVCLEKR